MTNIRLTTAGHRATAADPVPADAAGHGEAAAHDGDGTSRLRRLVRATAWIGGPLFLLTVVLHPARDGHSISSQYDWYEFIHALEATSLLIQAACLAGVLALGLRRFGPRGLTALYAALVGTVSWFALIIYDGSHNPVTARFAPQIVHTSADLDLSGAVILLAANLLFPLGYLLLGGLLRRHGERWTGLLLGAGGALYALGGTVSILGAGPHSVLTSILEVAGAAPYAFGYLLLGRTFGPHVTDEDNGGTS